MLAVVLSCASQAVKEDGCSRADREMVVCSGPPDRLEDIICPFQYLFGQSPACSQHKEQGRACFLYFSPHLGKCGTTSSGSRRGRYKMWSFSGFLLNRLDRAVEIIGQGDEYEGIFAGLVVDTAVAVLPVVEDLFGQRSQGAHRRDDEETLNPIGTG